MSEDTNTYTDEQRVTASRRSFLGAGALGLAGLALGGGVGSAAAQQDEGHPEFAVKQHDHSGKYGTTTNLGKSTPIESINVEDLVTEDTPLVDVRSYGVVGDGETDDAAAFQSAANAATPNGVLYIPHNVTLHFESSIDIDLGLEDSQVGSPTGIGPGNDPVKFTPFSLICHGILNPGENLGDAIHIHHGGWPTVFAQVQGGGGDIDANNSLRFSDLYGGFINVDARDYSGTVVQIDNGQTRIGGVSIGRLQTLLCGRSLNMEPGPNGDAPVIGGIGAIHEINETFSQHGARFFRTWDLQIGSYAANHIRSGVEITDANTIWIDSLETSQFGPYPHPNITFRNQELPNNNEIHINTLYTLDGHPGVIIDETVTNVRADIMVKRCEKGIVYRGGGLNTLNINAEECSDTAVTIEENTTGILHLSGGNLVNNDGNGLVVGTTNPVYLDKVQSENNGQYDLVVPEGNHVRITSSEFGSIEGIPKTYNNFGQTAANRERPDPENWTVGDIVDFTDTGDSSGNGLYALLPDRTWRKID